MFNVFNKKPKPLGVLVVECAERQELRCQSLLEDHFDRVVFVANWAQALDHIRKQEITHVVEKVSLLRGPRGPAAGLCAENDRSFATLKSDLNRLDFRLRKIEPDFKFACVPPPPPAKDNDEPQPKYAVVTRQSLRFGNN